MNRVVQHPVKAFAAALAAVAVLSIMDAVMKQLVLVIGIFAVSVWRSLANLVDQRHALFAASRAHGRAATHCAIHVTRGVVVTVMAFLFFWGIGRVPLAQAIALTFIAPLISLLLAAVFLHEQIGPRSIAGSIAAFAGVIVIVLGQARAQVGARGSARHRGDPRFGAMLCRQHRADAPAGARRRARSRSISSSALTVMRCGSSRCYSSACPHGPGSSGAGSRSLPLMSTAGTLLFAWAYARAEASYLAVTEYSAFLWAAALGWLVFREPCRSSRSPARC